MALISQPGSDYQLTEITLGAGNARDIICLLTDVHSALDHLYLDGAAPAVTAPAAEYLRFSGSPYTLPALIDALGEVITQLTFAMRDATGCISPPPHRPPHGPVLTGGSAVPATSMNTAAGSPRRVTIASR